MKGVKSQSSLQSTSNKTNYFPETTRCFQSTQPADLQLNIANSRYMEGEDYALPIVVDNYDAIDIFQLTANQMKLEIIEKQSNYAMAIIRNSKKIKISDYFNCLMWWGNKKANITAIKINISSNKNFSNENIKLCRLKALGRSNQQITNQFIMSFKDKMLKAGGLYKGPFPFDLIENEERIQQNQTNPFHLQSCACYILHKILSGLQKQKSEINIKLQQSLKQFHESFKNIQESSHSLPNPMINAMYPINYFRQISKQIAEQIRQNIYGNKDSSNQYMLIFPYLKIAVEKHVFDKVGHLLKQIYFQSSKADTQIFIEKSQTIKLQLSVAEIFEQILLQQQLQLVSNKQLMRQKQLAINDKKQLIEFVEVAYKLFSLQKIAHIGNIREKIKNCQIMYAELKSYFYQKLNKRYELNSMEDIIPVFIVIVLFCGCPQNKAQEQMCYNFSLRAQLNMMLDYINQYGEQFDAEKRLIVNLSESLNYIVRDWKIQKN